MGMNRRSFLKRCGMVLGATLVPAALLKDKPEPEYFDTFVSFLDKDLKGIMIKNCTSSNASLSSQALDAKFTVTERHWDAGAERVYYDHYRNL